MHVFGFFFILSISIIFGSSHSRAQNLVCLNPKKVASFKNGADELEIVFEIKNIGKESIEDLRIKSDCDCFNDKMIDSTETLRAGEKKYIFFKFAREYIGRLKTIQIIIYSEASKESVLLEVNIVT